MSYQPPEIQEIGSVRDLTLGQGFHGNADQVWIFSWGEEKPGLS